MKTLINQQKAYFNSNATKPEAFRLEQLKKLRNVLRVNEPNRRIECLFRSNLFSTPGKFL